MKLISAFIFALGIYSASVNGDGLGKPDEKVGSGTNLTAVDTGKSPAAGGTTSPSARGGTPVETTSSKIPLAEDHPPSSSTNENKSVTLVAEKPSNHSAPKKSSIPTSSQNLSSPITSPTPTEIPVTPVPPPVRLSWNVTEGNQTCILLTGKLELEVTANDTKVESPVTNQFRAVGSCKKNYITIYYDSSNTTTALTITFKKNDTAKDYFVHGINGTVSILKAPSPVNFGNYSLKLFATPLNKSYSCTPSADVFISKVPKQNITVSLKVSELKVQAFKTSKGSGFDSGIDCESAPIHTADLVPIIVGCALALLVIAVLAAYLISRRRSQARGYLSM